MSKKNTCGQCKYLDESGLWTACTYEAEKSVESTDSACDSFESSNPFADLQSAGDEKDATPEMAEEFIRGFMAEWFTPDQACEILDKCRSHFDDLRLVDLMGAFNGSADETTLRAA